MARRRTLACIEQIATIVVNLSKARPEAPMLAIRMTPARPDGKVLKS